MSHGRVDEVSEQWNAAPKRILTKKFIKHSKAKQPKGMRPVHNALMMPAGSCLCVKQALETGLFTEQTHVVAIEKLETEADKIKENLTKLGISHKVINKKLKDVTPDELQKAMRSPNRGLGRTAKKRKEELKFDYVYLDVMNCPTLKLWNWLNQVLTQAIVWSTPVLTTLVAADRTDGISEELYLAHRKEGKVACGIDEYKFSKNADQERLGCVMANFVLSALEPVSPHRTIKLGRMYKNGKKKMPMVMMYTSFAQKNTQRYETCRSVEYDLGYV